MGDFTKKRTLYEELVLYLYTIMQRTSTKPPLILLLGRDDWQKDINLNYILVHYIQKKGIAIAWEDPIGGAIWGMRHTLNRFFNISEFWDKLMVRGVQLLFATVNWRYCQHLFRQFNDNQHHTIDGRCRRVASRIKFLSKKYEVYIISRSSGGRVASLIADNADVKYMICLGYPFQNPENGKEPERYEHLPDVHTPFLIIQGKKDVYGGTEILEKYVFNPNTTVFLVDTDHGFNMQKPQWQQLFDKIEEVLPKSQVKTLSSFDLIPTTSFASN